MASVNQVLDHFARLAEETVKNRQLKISVGHLQSYEQYKYECGVLSGIQEAIGLLEEAVKKADEAEEL